MVPVIHSHGERRKPEGKHFSASPCQTAVHTVAVREEQGRSSLEKESPWSGCVCVCVCMCACVYVVCVCMCVCVYVVCVVYVVCLCISVCVRGPFISWLSRKEEGVQHASTRSWKEFKGDPLA